MKVSFTLSAGLFLLLSGLYFFKQEEKVMYILGWKETAAAPPKDSTIIKKKPTGKTTVRKNAPQRRRPGTLKEWTEGRFAPNITAVKTVDKTTGAVSGDILNYTVVITNNGTDATGLTFSDVVDPNTTVVEGSLQTSPVAFDDTYTAIGNVGITVPDANGILANDDLGINPGASFAAVTNAATTQGGTISITTSGGISYTPAAGFTGNDTYTYTLTNPVGSSSATITIAVTGMVWFINNNSGAASADGRLNTPFKTVAAFQAANDGGTGHPAANHFIFVHESATPYTGNITLLDGQKLIGQDATTTLPAITGYSLATYPYSAGLLPALNSGNATIVGLTATGTTNVITLNGGSGGSYTVRGLTISDKVSGAGISGNNFGTLNVTETTISGTGQALNLTTGALNATFTSVSSSSGVNSVLLNGITGTANLGVGALSGSTGASFSVSGGTAGITYNGTVSKTNAGKVVDIQNKTGGTVTFGGAVSATAPGEGVNLVSNTGATINFTGGLSLSTATNIAFNATGGGTISATQNNSTIVNTITTTTASALNVANTTIGNSGLTFRSINVGTSVSGPVTSGITLNTTGAGGLTVTGTGAAGSGGTIRQVQRRGVELISAQNISLTDMELLDANTGDAGFVGVCEELVNGGCYAALYASAVTNLQLTRVNITNTAEQGINLINVTTLTISNCTVQGNGDDNEEGALKAQDLKGTCSITNSTFKNSANRIAHIRNSTGAVDLTVNNCSFINEASNTSAVKQDCFQMRLKNTATATVNISNSIFKRAGTAAIQIMADDNSTGNVAITNCTVDREGTLMKGIEVGADQTARMNANVDGNPLVTAKGEVSLNLVSTGTASVVNAKARNNIVKGGNDQNYTFVQVNLWATQTATNNVLVSGNTVTEIDGRAGIESFALHSQPGSGTSTINATIQNNTVVGNASFITGNGMRASATATGGAPAASANCSFISGNSVTVASNRPQLNVVAVNSSTLRLAGTGTDVTSIWNGNGNTPMSPPALVQAAAVAPATITYGGAACPQPTGTPLARISTTTEAPQETVLAAVDASLPLQEDKVLEDTPMEENALTKEGLGTIAAKQEMLTSTLSASPVTTPTSVTVSGIGLPQSKSVTIKFQVTVNSGLPTSVCAISNQGSVSGGGITTLMTDNDANTSNGINPTVTKVLDVTPPVISGCPGTITVQTGPGNAGCTQTATWTEPTALDNCSGTLTFFSRSHAPGSSFSKGTTTVTYVFKDEAGNPNTCSFNVVVEDNTPPAITGCPGTVTVQTGAGAAGCSQTASWTEPTATDNCNGSLTYFSRSHAPGATFNKGTTAVTYVFKDEAGTESTCTFNVVVEDNTPPVISGCPGTITVQTGPGNAGCTQTATWTEPTALDNCSGTLAFFSRSHAPGSSFSKGTTTVTYVFKDEAGNPNTCSFNVVVEDNTPPVLTCPDNVVVVESPSGSGSATVTYPAAMVNDNCSGVGTIQYSKASGTSFPLGATTVNVSVTDAAGNPATCSFTVTVNPACQITPPAGVVVNATAGQCGAAVNYSAATTSGNCGALTYSKASGSFFPVGTTTVFVSSLSTGQSSSFNVTVNDNQNPQITTCPDNVSVNTDAGACTALVPFSSINKAVATDNCETGLTVRYYLNYGTGSQQEITGAQSFAKGTTTVTVEARDASNHTATCTFTVTVNDNELPAITCPQNVVVNAQASGCSAIVPFSTINTAMASDNCPTGLTKRYYLNYGTESQQEITGNRSFSGTTTVTAEAKDATGNTRTCTFTVTVTPTADLRLTKVASPSGTVVAGTNVTYTLTIDNDGPCDAGNVSLTDDLPSAVTFVSLTAPQGWNTSTPTVGASGTVTATKTTFASGGSAVFTLVAKVNSNATGSLSNTASVRSDTQDLVPGNNSGTAVVALTSQADLVVTKTASEPTPQAGTSLTYTVTVTNNGPSHASNVSMTDALPSGVTFSSLSGILGFTGTSYNSATHTVSGQVSSLAPGGSASLKINVGIPGTTAHNTPLANTAAVSSSTSDPNTENNSATANVTVINCVLTCPDNITVYTGAGSTQCGKNVNFGAQATSGCGTVTYSTASGAVTSGAFFPVGTTTVTARASNTGQTCTFTITVVDDTKPVTSFDESTVSLWPPNHKLVKVATFNTTDNCGIASCSVTVVSSDPENGTGDGDTSPDYVVDYTNMAVWVRAERGNSKEQRVYKITLTCTDVNGNEISKQKQVVISHNITAPITGTTFKIGSTVAFSGVFWDKPGNKHTGSWLVDGTTVKGSVTEPSGTKNGKMTGSYKFSTAGIYKLQMNVTDQNKVTSFCNTNEDMEAIVVIYDPNGGYTYGGGYFQSPAGALAANPTAAGKANFGFTVNYYKGASLPKGETQFEFKVGDFEYNALNFDYLSISGYKAVFKGSGKISGGQSGINFIMYVIDGALDGSNVDKVRLKIYNKNTGEVYYDSEPGASDAANPKTPVGANSTVVISGSSNPKNREAIQTELAPTASTELLVTASPNPSRNDFVLTINSGNTKDAINMRVVDGYGRTIESRKLGAAAEQTIRFGSRLRPGWYLVEIVQGTVQKQLKLMKLSD